MSCQGWWMDEPKKELTEAEEMRQWADIAVKSGNAAIKALKLMQDNMEMMGYTEGEELSIKAIIEAIEEHTTLARDTADQYDK